MLTVEFFIVIYLVQHPLSCFCRVHDCWLVAHGKVYDATPMLFEHPAGVRSILRHAGQDATVDFDFHSNGARKMWKQYEIGTLEGHESKCTIM